MVSYVFNHSGTHAIVKGEYKIVREGRRPWALYHLAEDRTELNDLAKKHPARLKKMVAQWHDIAKNKERLPAKQLKPVSRKLTPQKFGLRADPGAKK